MILPLTWQPRSSVFEDQENTMIVHHGHIVQSGSKQRRPMMTINSVTASTCADDAADLMEGNNFADQLERDVNVSHICTERIINTHKFLSLLPMSSHSSKGTFNPGARNKWMLLPWPKGGV